MDSELHALKPRTRWLAHPLEVHGEIDSTNLRAEALAAQGANAGTVVMADRQTAGRGRLGRSFFSPGGVGLYLSVILRPACTPERAHEHVFAAALAVAECAVQQLGDPSAVEIKWPNDVLLSRRKTSGINLSVQLDGSRIASLVLGIGVNVNTPREQFPPELREIATSLRAEVGRPLDRAAFGAELLGRLEREIDLLAGGGFAKLLDRWRELFRMRGERVRIHADPTPAIEGSVVDVDATGALLVEGQSGIERIVAGDVTLLRRGA
jgi:BirA family transcriptional regulator, biotin operon repressor / biotin---[acetyl-CoA-carboxylase] ligase